MNSFNIKNIVLILISISLVVGAFYLAEKNNTEKENIFEEGVVVGTPNNKQAVLYSISEKDSDSDGLKDWEEVLWGTDQNNPDTDKDGTADGKEVGVGRNPIKSGPDDVISKRGDKNNDIDTKNEVRFEDLPLTDRLGRELFARYADLKQAGLGGDPQSQADVVSDITLGSEYFIYPKVYIESEIKKTTDNSKERVRRYGNELALAFQVNLIKSKHEAIIAQEAINTNNPDKLKEIQPILNSYIATLDALLKIEVPSSLVPAHTQVVNGAEQAIFSARALMSSLVDPLVGIQGAAQVLEAGQTLYTGLQGVKTGLSNVGVWYPQGEPGYLINPVQ